MCTLCAEKNTLWAPFTKNTWYELRAPNIEKKSTIHNMWNCFSFNILYWWLHSSFVIFFYVFIIIIISTIKRNKAYTYNVWPILYELTPIQSTDEAWVLAMNMEKKYERKRKREKRTSISVWTWNALMRTYLQLLAHVPNSMGRKRTRVNHNLRTQIRISSKTQSANCKC